MSEADALQRQKKREIRGSILRTLAEAYGTTHDLVSLKSLCHVVRQATERELETELQYLIDLGYVARDGKRDALDKTPPAYWRLLAKGMQVINGDLEDRSIEL